MAVAYALVVGFFILGSMRLKDMPDVLSRSAMTSAVVLLLVGLKISDKKTQIPSPLIDKPVPTFDLPVLVDFWADWCAPCHAIAPQLARVVADLQGAVRLVKVEVDAGENMKLAGHYRLRGFPTIMLFEGGAERARFSGARAAHWIEHWVQQHLA